MSNPLELSSRQKELLLDMCMNMPGGKEGWIFSREGKAFHFPLLLTPSMAETDIMDLDMKPRANHALKRAGIDTVGELTDIVQCTGDLKQFRNLGAKTASEIMHALFFFQYSLLRPERRKTYMADVYRLNMNT